MLLPRFDYHSPKSLSEASRMLGEFKDQAKLLAGGTDLLVNMKHKQLTPKHVVAIDRLPGLDEISGSKTEVSVGPLATAAALAESKVLKGALSVLAQGASKLGSPLIRNRATLGGNLANARPASDLAPPLLALGARVVLAKSDGEREVPLEEFFKGPGRTVIEPDEILTRVIIPRPEPGSGGGFIKLALRQSLEIAIVNVAAVLTLDKSGKKIQSARVAMGAVAPTPIRSPEAENALVGATAGPKALEAAAQAAGNDAACITDFRCPADYKSMMVEVLIRRSLEQALAAAMKK